MTVFETMQEEKITRARETLDGQGFEDENDPTLASWMPAAFDVADSATSATSATSGRRPAPNAGLRRLGA